MSQKQDKRIKRMVREQVLGDDPQGRRRLPRKAERWLVRDVKRGGWAARSLGLVPGQEQKKPGGKNPSGLPRPVELA